MSEDAVKLFEDRKLYSTPDAAAVLGVKPEHLTRTIAPTHNVAPIRLGPKVVRWLGESLNELVAVAAVRPKGKPTGAAAARQKQAG